MHQFGFYCANLSRYTVNKLCKKLRSTNIGEIFINYKNKNNDDDDDNNNNNINNNDDDNDNMVPALNTVNMHSAIISGELRCFVNHRTVIYTCLEYKASTIFSARIYQPLYYTKFSDYVFDDVFVSHAQTNFGAKINFCIFKCLWNIYCHCSGCCNTNLANSLTNFVN